MYPLSTSPRGPLLFIVAALLGCAACRDEAADSGTGPFALTPATIIWERPAGAPSEGIVALQANAFSTLFAASLTGRLYRSADLGLHWDTVFTGADGSISSLALGGTTLLAGSSGGVLLSNDNGGSWQLSDSGLADRAVSALLALPDGHLLAGTLGGRLYVSTNGGVRWSQQAYVARPIIQLCLTSGGWILMSAWDLGLYRFTESSPALLSAEGGMGDPYISAVASSARGYEFAGTYYFGIYRSSTGGASWLTLDNAPQTGMRSLFVRGTTDLLAGTAAGTFVSYDNGMHWAEADSGLGGAVVSAFAETPAGRLFAGTDRGIFRATTTTHASTSHTMEYQQ